MPKKKIKVPKSMSFDIYGSSCGVWPDPDGKSVLFFENPLHEKPHKSKDLICQLKNYRMSCFSVKENIPNAIFDLTVKELEAFAKAAKKSEAYFKRLDKKNKRKSFGTFLMHLTPELTFAFRKK